MSAVADTGRWLVIILFLTIFAVASFSDIRSRRIPNWTVLAIAILFVPWTLLVANIGFLSGLAAALIIFSVSFPLYYSGVIGAGDSKLLTAAALFVGLSQLLQFLVLVALAGGVIAVGSLLTRPTQALVMFQMRGKGHFGRGVPYGVAISIAAVYVVTWPLARDALG